MGDVPDDRRCPESTAGVKMPSGRVYIRSPRPCRNWTVKGYSRCAVHLYGEEFSRWYDEQRRRAKEGEG